MEAGVNYDSKNIGKCGKYKTRAALENACSADINCAGYSTISLSGYNKGGVAENGFYPWCLKRSLDKRYVPGNHNFYRKTFGGIIS